ncbi:SDR family oxidoreductase [Radiobacillus kanasensis]|uniref:SDR family oxidoreductase n=1 Tax=Radiobacillus kanasensis TaxID=2844358 RepID=UPI001E5397E6|nr:SDR family oxidoreductase [Radiobacillus kanasensis]UFU00517.1 SDR family oxidoreductase [Radiobacillus kanasensis]
MVHKGSIAVVTGVGHQGDIGTAICRRLTKAGHDIFFTDWGSKGWSNTFQEELRAFGVRCEKATIDLAQRDAPARLLDAVTEKLGFPAILVNNAAYSVNDGYEQLTADLLDRHYEVNMRGTMLLSVEFAKRFEQTNLTSGRIINMTSGQAKGPMVEELAYASTKGAITAFTSTLSAEIATLGITVNAVNPGPTDSGWMTDDIKTYLKPKFGFGRIGTPDDAARLVNFLASEEAAWITGQVIDSEGGFLRN